MPIFNRRVFYLTVKLGTHESVWTPIRNLVKRPGDVPFEARIEAQSNLPSIRPNPPDTGLTKFRFSMPDQHAPHTLAAVLWVRRHGAQPMVNEGRQILVLLRHERPDSHHKPVVNHAKVKDSLLSIHRHCAGGIRLFFRPKDCRSQRPRQFR